MNDVKIQWTCRERGNIDVVYVYRSTSSSGGTSGTKIATLDGHIEEYLDKGIPNGTTYYYVIEQVRHNGESIFCEPIKVESSNGSLATTIDYPIISEKVDASDPTVESSDVSGIGEHLSTDWYFHGDDFQLYEIEDSTNLTQYSFDFGDEILKESIEFTAQSRYHGSHYDTGWSDPITLTYAVGTISNGLIFLNDLEAMYYRQIATPTSPEAILNTWPRSSGSNYWDNPNDATNNAKAWYYDASRGSFVQPQNSSQRLQILSPEKSENVILEATLASDENDNDAIGLVVASDVYDGQLLSLVAVVEAGGGFVKDSNDTSLRMETFKLVFLDSGSNGVGDIVDANSVVPHSGGWSSSGQTRVIVERRGSIVTAKMSPWNNLNSYVEASELSVDINDLPRNGHKLGTGSRFGFFTLSQSGSTYYDIRIQSDGYTDDNVIYSSTSRERWEFKNGTWIQDGSIIDDFSESDVVLNPLTKEYYRNNDPYFPLLKSEGITGTIPIIRLNQTGTNYTNDQIADLYAFEGGILKVVSILSMEDCNVTLSGNEIDLDLLGNYSGRFWAHLEAPDGTLGLKRYDLRQS